MNCRTYESNLLHYYGRIRNGFFTFVVIFASLNSTQLSFRNGWQFLSNWLINGELVIKDFFPLD